MIVVFSTFAHQYTFKIYFRDWSQSLNCRMRLVPYEMLHRLSGLRPCTIIFSDVERLSVGQRIVTDSFCENIQASSGNKFRILNHPIHSHRRLELLTRLNSEGINAFRIHRLDATRSDICFPVFLRNADDHSGPISKLLHNHQQLNRAIIHATIVSSNFESLVITEYCNVQEDNGIFRKFSAFKIGDEILPAHMLFNRGWMQKENHVSSEEFVEEEMRYLAENPHLEQLRKIFEIANIQYGRIDYGVLEGRVQVWEINTNPMLFRPRKAYSDDYIGTKEALAVRISQAFNAINMPDISGNVPVQKFDSQSPALLEKLISAQRRGMTHD